MCVYRKKNHYNKAVHTIVENRKYKSVVWITKVQAQKSWWDSAKEVPFQSLLTRQPVLFCFILSFLDEGHPLTEYSVAKVSNKIWNKSIPAPKATTTFLIHAVISVSSILKGLQAPHNVWPCWLQCVLGYLLLRTTFQLLLHSKVIQALLIPSIRST